jgi:hypothetical protein
MPLLVTPLRAGQHQALPLLDLPTSPRPRRPHLSKANPDRRPSTSVAATVEPRATDRPLTMSKLPSGLGNCKGSLPHLISTSSSSSSCYGSNRRYCSNSGCCWNSTSNSSCSSNSNNYSPQGSCKGRVTRLVSRGLGSCKGILT